MKYYSTPGTVLAALYLITCTYLIATQGLFGESFIALILGMPWSLIFVSFEYGNMTGAMLYFMILAPIVFNAFVLYWIGWLIGRFTKKA